MDRRQFIRTGTAIAAGAAFVSRAAFSTPAIRSTSGYIPASSYHVRFRYGFLPGQCAAWVRVSRMGNATQAIPFQLLVSTTADMQNVVSSDLFYANPRHSFATRTKFSTRGHRQLFVQVRLVDDPKVVSRVWKIRRRRKKVAANG